MTSLGKKILSAFMEVAEEKKGTAAGSAGAGGTAGMGSAAGMGAADAGAANAGGAVSDPGPENRPGDRYAGHFDKLLSEANIPGPDYYEFSRMTGVMRGIPDEAARYNAAFAGLQVQGLNKERLLETAGAYLEMLQTDAGQFQKTVEAALAEKVNGKEAEAEEKARRIQALSQEIVQLQQQISDLQAEVRANREKLTGGNNAYAAESRRRQEEIRRDMEKIKQYIH